jgi:choline dehydrogenase
VMADGVQLARQFFANVAEPVAPLVELRPGSQFETADQLKEDIRYNTFSHHAASSCAIGADGDLSTCVDSRFRVHGVDNLRVVDASVFPKIPGTFPQIPVYMVSEKAVDTILEDAGFSPVTVNFDDATLESLGEDAVLEVTVL